MTRDLRGGFARVKFDLIDRELVPLFVVIADTNGHNRCCLVGVEGFVGPLFAKGPTDMLVIIDSLFATEEYADNRHRRLASIKYRRERATLLRKRDAAPRP